MKVSDRLQSLSLVSNLHKPSIPPQTRLIIGIAGIPASGKSTLVKLIVDHTNAILKTGVGPVERTEAIAVGLDGWHLTRAQLAALPDPQLAKDRRGAHWTFDPDGYLEFVKTLRLPPDSVTEPIIAPSFDHAVGDPDPTGVKVYPQHRIVVIEGLYCFLSVGAWKEAGETLDERWLTTVDFEKATERITSRHVASGVAKSIDVGSSQLPRSICVAHEGIQEAQWRARENDMPSTSVSPP
jgi:pantothenate kinase